VFASCERVAFAQEVRFYAPAVLAVALATLLLLRALDEPSVAGGRPMAAAWR